MSMVCQACGNPGIVNYCPQCGEKKFDPHELSTGHFVEQTVEVFSHFDNKFLRTLKTLILRPGKASLEYCNGIRIPYMKPMAFFLLTNILFFLLVLRMNTFSLPLYNYITYSPFTRFHSGEHLAKKLKKDSIEYKQYEVVFNEKMKSNSKLFIVIFIPLIALTSALIFVARKRKMGEHLVFAAHFMSFVLYLFLASSLVTYILFNVFDVAYSDGAVTISLMLLICIYSFFSFRRFYSVGIIWGISAAILIGFLFLSFVQVYRILLFFKILYIG